MSVNDLKREKELLEKARNKKESFEGLYSYFINDVYRFAYSILNDKHNAEDITSRAFMEFYKKNP